MDIAKVFQTGQSQAVRIPKEYRFAESEVSIRHFGNGVLLLPINHSWELLSIALGEFEPEFKITKDQPEVQSRTEIVGE